MCQTFIRVARGNGAINELHEEQTGHNEQALIQLDHGGIYNFCTYSLLNALEHFQHNNGYHIIQELRQHSISLCYNRKIRRVISK